MRLLFRNSLFSIMLFIVLILISTNLLSKNQTRPVIGLHQNTPNVIAIKNARIITEPGKMLQNATMIIRDGFIEDIGLQVIPPADAVIIDLSNKTIYPGLIDIYTNLGVSTKSEKGNNSNSVKSSSSANINYGSKHWNEAVHPQLKAANLLKISEKDAEALRNIGFTTVVTYPSAGIFRGSGALVLLNSETPNQAIIATDVAQAISFNKGKGVRGYPRSLKGSIALIRQTFLDAQWYNLAWSKIKPGAEIASIPETNLALASLKPYMTRKKPVIFDVSDELDVLRVAKISKEFNLNTWVLSDGYEYRRLTAIKKSGLKLVVSLNFPEPPDLSSLENEFDYDLRTLKHWEFAPYNSVKIANAGIDFVLTGASLKKKNKFLSNLRLAVKRGLPSDDALKALTVTPANWLKMSNLLGTLEKGKLANFIITNGDLFTDKTKILDTWVAGKKYEVTKLPEVDVRGTWKLTIKTDSKIDTGSITISGEINKLKSELQLINKKLKVKKIEQENNLLHLSFSGDQIGYDGIARLNGLTDNKAMFGTGTWGDGAKFTWQTELMKPWQEKPDTTKDSIEKIAGLATVYPDGGFGRTKPPVQPAILIVKNSTVWTCGPEGIIENCDLLVKNGKIVEVGKNIEVPLRATVIDATGKEVTPGIIDAHSHLAISGGGNEGSHAVTSEVRISDVINCNDINIYRQLAGGVTASCIIHGSANPIGGQYSIIKLRWGALPDEMILHDAKPGIKFALGENVKQANWGNNPNPRYPQTRMGVEQIIRDAFIAAKDYQQEWQIYRKKSKKMKNLIPPRINLRYEPLTEVLEGKRIIHCHSYRQDEIIALMRLAEELGFKIDVFIHVMEGYKVAKELAEHGAMATTFSDWWSYKFEAFDAIPYNGALMHEQKVVVSFDSDSKELARRLNTEASKAVKYGNVPPEEALKFVTLYAAKQVFLDSRIGSLEKGKDADFVIWSGSPLSSFSVCEQTWIDGRKYFDIEEDKRLREKNKSERALLIQKILSKDSKGGKK